MCSQRDKRIDMGGTRRCHRLAIRLGRGPGSAIDATGGHHGQFMTLRGAYGLTEGTKEWAGIRGRGNHRIYLGTAWGSYGESMGTALSITIGWNSTKRKAKGKTSGDNRFESPRDHRR